MNDNIIFCRGPLNKYRTFIFFLLAPFMQNAAPGVSQGIGKTCIMTWYDNSCFKGSFAKRNLILLQLIEGKLVLVKPAFHHMHCFR